MEMSLLWCACIVFLGYVLFRSLQGARNARGAALGSGLALATLGLNTNVPPAAYSLTQIFVGLCLAVGMLSPRGNRMTHPVKALVLLWFLLFCLSTGVSNSEGIVLLAPYALFGVAATFVASKMTAEDRRLFAWLLVATASVHSVLTVSEFMGQEPALWGYGRREDGGEVVSTNPFLGGNFLRAQSTLGHPIAAATFIAAGFLSLLVNRRNYRAVPFVGLLALLSTGLLLTGTRSVVLAVGISLAFLYVASSSSRNRFVKGLVGAVILLMFGALDFGTSAFVDELVESGSFTNRAGALESIPQLLTRPVLDVVLGSGFASEARLFALGFFQQNGFNIVDNQLVTTLATAGVVGLFGLIIVLIYAFRIADNYSRTILVFMTVMLFSFDYFRWHVMAILLFSIVGYASSTRSAVRQGHRLDEAERAVQPREYTSRDGQFRSSKQ